VGKVAGQKMFLHTPAATRESTSASMLWSLSALWETTGPQKKNYAVPKKKKKTGFREGRSTGSFGETRLPCRQLDNESRAQKRAGRKRRSKLKNINWKNQERGELGGRRRRKFPWESNNPQGVGNLGGLFPQTKKKKKRWLEK